MAQLPNTVKYGKAWTDQDWEHLKLYQKEKKSLADICKLMDRTTGSIQAALPRLIRRCVEKDNKTIDEVVAELNIVDVTVITKAKQYIQAKNDKMLKIAPPPVKPIQVEPSMIYRGKIEVSIHSLNKVIIKTDSTETEFRYPNVMDEFECLSQVFVTLLKHTNPGTEITLTTLSVELDECGKGVDKDRSFNNKMNGNELMCYALYKTASELYDISNYIWE